MRRPGTGRIAALLMTALLVGCSHSDGRRLGGPRDGGLLMGREASAPLATQISRSAWPATWGRVESQETTYYYEFYRDYFTNAQNERNTPYRYFQSYRVGATQR
jgi:hypothetical protein